MSIGSAPSIRFGYAAIFVDVVESRIMTLERAFRTRLHISPARTELQNTRD
jgi:hypothetical protein